MGAVVVAFIVTVLVALRFVAVPALKPGLTLNFPTLLLFPLVALPLLPDLLAP